MRNDPGSLPDDPSEVGDTLTLPVRSRHRAPRTPVRRRWVVLGACGLLVLVAALGVLVAPAVGTSGGDDLAAIPTESSPDPSRQAARPPAATPSAATTPDPVRTPAVAGTPVASGPAPTPDPPPPAAPPATSPPAPVRTPTAAPCDAPGNSEHAHGNGGPRCP